MGVLLLTLFTLSQAGNIYFKTSKKKGEKIKVRSAFTGKPELVGLTGELLNNEWIPLKVSSPNGGAIIKGFVTDINIANNEIVGFSSKDNPHIERVWLVCNKLKSIPQDAFRNCDNLRTVGVYQNEFSKFTATNLAFSLPDRKGKKAGELFISAVVNRKLDKNKFNSATILAAQLRNWKVFSYLEKGTIIHQPNYVAFSPGVKVGGKIWLELGFPEEYKEDVILINGIAGPIKAGVAQYEVTANVMSYITLDGFTRLSLGSTHQAQPIKELACIQSNTLTFFAFNKTGVKRVDLSKCPKLKTVECNDNGMTAEETLALIQSLPIVSDGEKGEVYLYDLEDKTPNKWNNLAIIEANKRGWKLFGHFKKGEPYEEIKEKDETGYHTISFKTNYKVGEVIEILIRFKAGSDVEFTGLSGTPKQGWNKYKLTSSEVSICGAITKLTIPRMQVTSIDLEENSTLEALHIWGNYLINGVDLSKQHALKKVTFEGNGISLKTFEQMMNNLPNRSKLADKGDIRIISFRDKDKNRNEYNTDVIMAAAKRGWYTSEDLEVGKNVETRAIHPGQVSFTTKKATGSTIRSNIWFYLPINMKGLEGNPICGKWGELTLRESSVTLSGAFIELGVFYSEITSIDLHKNTIIMSINFSGNELKSLDVSGCTALSTITIDGNQITGENMTNFMKSLPENTDEQGGRLVLSEPDQQMESNTWTKEDLEIANSKGWAVVDSNGKLITTGHDTAIDSVLAPVIHETTIYNIDGIRMTMPIDQLPAGVYIVNGKKQFINAYK